MKFITYTHLQRPNDMLWCYRLLRFLLTYLVRFRGDQVNEF